MRKFRDGRHGYSFNIPSAKSVALSSLTKTDTQIDKLLPTQFIMLRECVRMSNASNRLSETVPSGVNVALWYFTMAFHDLELSQRL